jgi:hypothetical protein
MGCFRPTKHQADKTAVVAIFTASIQRKGAETQRRREGILDDVKVVFDILCDSAPWRLCDNPRKV